MPVYVCSRLCVCLPVCVCLHAGLGLDEVIAEFKTAGDDYSYIMAEALADRLAEALAEKLHEMVRRDFWGYAPDEALSVDDMLKVKYQVRGRQGPRGIRCSRAVAGVQGACVSGQGVCVPSGHGLQAIHVFL